MGLYFLIIILFSYIFNYFYKYFIYKKFDNEYQLKKINDLYTIYS